ncbi:hypothetical protein C922_00465 [Plasmodium inui San Antonio 1]|uniref:Uncharacterized protein n=1 Tax=Plasmodium inui San Antonio 1 TaxID=1237626 RepID=W7A6N1_9APIC|nr:hypothetical protein C922_00465 [Plasmodium inui San Antonio 1]EUD68777.1 hypothetical protein C922_00465 [Plasmodium inui San Antonio 1]
MEFFQWKEDNVNIGEETKKRLDKSIVKSEDVYTVSELLKRFRTLKFDNLNYHSDRCILARECALVYVLTYKKHIESLKEENIHIVVRSIKRSILSVNNIISNITEQILKCFTILRNLYNDILKLNNVYLADYCLFSIIDGILGNLNDEKLHQSKPTLWGMAGFLSLIISNYKKAYFMYKGIISYKCIFTIPIFLEESAELRKMAKSDLYNIILKENDEDICSNFSRFEAYTKLHLSIFIILNDTREVWSYISELFNSAYRRKKYIYFCLIYSALDVSSHYCKITFTSHFENLLRLLKTNLMPILEDELKKKPPPSSQEKVVQYYIKKLHVEHLDNLSNSSLPEGVVVLPDEKLLYMGLGP